MGTQHRHSRKLRFKIDDEWEHLDAPMFCDFLAAEFVGNRLGGQLTEESSSSSFFNNQVILEGMLLHFYVGFSLIVRVRRTARGRCCSQS